MGPRCAARSGLRTEGMEELCERRRFGVPGATTVAAELLAFAAMEARARLLPAVDAGMWLAGRGPAMRLSSPSSSQPPQPPRRPMRLRRNLGTKVRYILRWKVLVVPNTMKASMLGDTPDRYPVTVDMARFSERSGPVSARPSRTFLLLERRGARFVHSKTLCLGVSGLSDDSQIADEAWRGVVGEGRGWGVGLHTRASGGL